jgi:hypothetical protein
MFERAADPNHCARAWNFAKKLADKTRLPDTWLARYENEAPVAMRIQAQLRQTRKFIGPPHELTVYVTVNPHGSHVRSDC